MEKKLEEFIAIDGNAAILEDHVKTMIEAAMEEKKGSFSEQLKTAEENSYNKGLKAGKASKDKTESKDSKKEPECFKKYPKVVKDVTKFGCRKCSFHKACKGK